MLLSSLSVCLSVCLAGCQSACLSVTITSIVINETVQACAGVLYKNNKMDDVATMTTRTSFAEVTRRSASVFQNGLICERFL